MCCLPACVQNCSNSSFCRGMHTASSAAVGVTAVAAAAGAAVVKCEPEWTQRDMRWGGVGRLGEVRWETHPVGQLDAEDCDGF